MMSVESPRGKPSESYSLIISPAKSPLPARVLASRNASASPAAGHNTSLQEIQAKLAKADERRLVIPSCLASSPLLQLTLTQAEEKERSSKAAKEAREAVEKGKAAEVARAARIAEAAEKEERRLATAAVNREKHLAEVAATAHVEPKGKEKAEGAAAEAAVLAARLAKEEAEVERRRAAAAAEAKAKAEQAVSEPLPWPALGCHLEREAALVQEAHAEEVRQKAATRKACENHEDAQN